MDHGFETRDANGLITFNLSTRITKVLLDTIVEKDSSTAFTIEVPDGLEVVLTAVALDGDEYVRHYPHNVVLSDPYSIGVSQYRDVNCEPSLPDDDHDFSGYPAWAQPLRTRSQILVYACIPE